MKFVAEQQKCANKRVVRSGALSDHEQTSGAAEEPAKSNSVYDFLYCDHGRLGSLLAQFNSFGALRELTHRQSVSSSTGGTSQESVKAKIPTIAEGDLGSSSNHSMGEEEGRDSVYDPRWVNALNFLDEITARGLLVDNLSKAGIGQLVILTGELAVFDMSLFEKMWAQPAIKKAIIAAERPQDTQHGGNRQQRKAAEKLKGKKGTPSEAEIASELMGILPHSVQGAVYTDDIQTWFTLDPANLTVKSSDMFLKHGLSPDGAWTVIGALDAFPDDTNELSSNLSGLSNENLHQMAASTRLSQMAYLLGLPMLHPIKGLLGRPPEAYGITPLAIVRAIGEPA